MAFQEISALKITIAISTFFLLSFLTSSGQRNIAAQVSPIKKDTSSFYLSYKESGLGSNLGHFLPTIKIRNGTLLFSYEQNSYLVVKENRIDTICVRQVRQSSIDSILNLVEDLKDTTIDKYNHCMMSGSIHFMTITNGTDTTRFELMNTFDYTALKIANILNTYLPLDKKLYANEQMIIEADECIKRHLENWKRNIKKKGLKKRQKKTPHNIA